MEILTGFFIIGLVHFLAAAAPGPDFVMVSQVSLRHGRKSGILCSLGITLGLSVHIAYSSLGLAAVIANSSSLIVAIRLIGGLYLIYLGYCTFRNKSTGQITGSNPTPSISSKRLISQGFACNALNPKAPIYFVSLFSIILTEDLTLYQLLFYSAWIMLIQMGWFSALTFALTTKPIRSFYLRCSRIIEILLGGIMIALGIKVISARG